ncbi:retrotransposon protein, putative, ty1-copia subclass [Tanacetum coccineum]
MDSGCSYHMTPRLDIYFDFLECDGGSVLLGDNKECKIRVVLSGIRRDNCVYYLDGHAVAGELSASIEEKDNLAQVKSLGGKRYFLSIVDDYSRMVWVYILRFKHEAFGKFKEWKQLVENQTGRTVKKMRTDNGLEFYNQEFEQLCIKSGIYRHLTVARTSQQNGLAEQATCTDAYLINRSPSTTIEKETPMEMWLGHPSDYEMLRIFDRVAISHIKQGKLELREVKCVLLGYPEGVKGYKLYRLDDESPKIVTSRNVVFNESVMYKDTLKDFDACINKFVEELQVEVELQRLNNHTLKKNQTNQEDGDDEDAGDQETDQTLDLTDYYCKWLFKIKEGIECVQKPRYKERLVARRFTRRAGIDYNEVFSLVVRHKSIWVILALTACKDYELEQLEVKTTILHRNLEEVIYMRSYAPGEYIYLLLYVEDMLIACKSKAEIGFTKYLLKKEFDIKELEEAKNILGAVCKCGWEPNVLDGVHEARHSVCGLVYGTDRGNHVEVIGFVDSDYTKDSDKEYMSLTEAMKEAIWLRGLLEELGIKLNTVVVNCDNQGVIHLSRNYVFHERTKHTNVRYHFIKEVLEAKTVNVLKVGTEHNAADALTKVVPGLKL